MNISDTVSGNQSKHLAIFTGKRSDIYERITRAALPFLRLYKPLEAPIYLGLGIENIFISTIKFIKNVQQRNSNSKICFSFLETTLTVIAVTATAFNHPIGIVLITSHHIALEFTAFVRSLKTKDTEASLFALTKLMSETLYLALVLRGGIELSVASIGIYAVSLIFSSKAEFKKSRIIESSADLLMAAIKTRETYAEFKILHRKWKSRPTSTPLSQF